MKVEWYTEYGFKDNPLEINPLEASEDPVGFDQEIEDLLYYVESGNVILIEGPKSSGKTLLLGQVIEKFGGKGRIVYIDGNNLNRKYQIDELLTDAQGFFRRMFKKRPKGMILLLDNSVDLPLKTYEMLQYYFDQDYLHSVVFTAADGKKLAMPKSMRDRIGSRTIKTKTLSRDAAVDMVLDRLNQDIISKDMLEKLHIMSDNDMKRFLVNCNKVFDYMVDEEKDDIDLKTMTKVVNEDSEYDELLKDEVSEDAFVDEETGEKLVKVGEHYRSPDDLYCPECGALIDEDDDECPSCGVIFEEADDDEEEKKRK
ncbi:AAA family ATPase [Candidatus Woesearchaeota archaeon]|nr:AAA family ATPase [Candidatus Woesearchaeota archaeon]